MFIVSSGPAIVGALVITVCSAMPARAAGLSYVSAKGPNPGDCSTPAAPCRSFAYALGKTTAGGTIKAIDPGNYSPVAINKAITLSGVPGAGIARNTAGDAIVVNAPTTDVVTIEGLTLNGMARSATNGIRATRAKRLVVRDCTIRGFAYYGINLSPTNTLVILIESTVITSNGNGNLLGAGTGATVGTIDRVTASGADLGTGLVFYARARVAVTDTLVSSNNVGIYAAPGATLRLTRSVVSQNPGTGLYLDLNVTAPTATSAGDNFIRGNGTDIGGGGTLSNIGTD